MVDVSSDINESNVTLEDDAWKDSFDKLLGSKPELRRLNILKKEVRASFNMNSSVENFSNDSSKDFLQVVSPQLRFSDQSDLSGIGTKGKIKDRCGSISTPMGKQLLSNPFQCSLSPISAWKLRFCDRSDLANNKLQSMKENPIEINVFDHDKENEEMSANTKGVLSELITTRHNKRTHKSKSIKTKTKRKTSQKHVFFEGIKEDMCINNEINEKILKPTTQQRLSSKSDRTIKDRQQVSPQNIGSSKNFTRGQTLPSSIQRLSLNSNKAIEDRPTSLLLQPGKWRKSLNIWRRTQNAQKRISGRNLSATSFEDSLNNTGVVIVGHRKSIFLKPHGDFIVPNTTSCIVSKSVWEDRVVKLCKQSSVLDFAETYKVEEMINCRKIGEGAYGEVFIMHYDDPIQDTVLKIIPIEGKELINGEVQKSYEQILPEIVISEELSNLKDNEVNSTSGYVRIKKIACVKGKYPIHLLSLWEEYDEEKGSENDNPDILPNDQRFIVLELAYSGKDLEGFVFNNAEQAYYALQQIILTLAVGEEAFCFEHRDLHWGNILVMNTTEKFISYKLQEETLRLPTKGVRITIIDYTLSRISYGDCCLYNDLSCDEELFSATGDYQFDIYRMMRDVLKNKWENFEPKTNIFWLSYLTKKMLKDVNYKNTRTKTHAAYINKLKHLDTLILDFSSAVESAKYFKH